MIDKNELKIMVVERDVLFRNRSFDGFIGRKEFDFENIILSNFEFMRRGDAESDLMYKQPIAYAVIMNNKEEIFVYRRAKNANYHERRLRGKWSVGIGGHIELFDNGENPIEISLRRELREEVNVKDARLELLGYINDDSNDVGKVHFGVLYLAKVKEDPVISDKENIDGKMHPILEIKTMVQNEDFEDWSRIALKHLIQ